MPSYSSNLWGRKSWGKFLGERNTFSPAIGQIPSSLLDGILVGHFPFQPEGSDCNLSAQISGFQLWTFHCTQNSSTAACSCQDACVFLHNSVSCYSSATFLSALGLMLFFFGPTAVLMLPSSLFWQSSASSRIRSKLVGLSWWQEIVGFKIVWGSQVEVGALDFLFH